MEAKTSKDRLEGEVRELTNELDMWKSQAMEVNSEVGRLKEVKSLKEEASER